LDKANGSDDVVVEPGVAHPEGSYLPVSYRIWFGPVVDDRRSEEQILDHITRALQQP
jgi:hypothetical protein